MKVPIVLFVLSLSSMALFWTSPDLYLLAVLAAVASAVLLVMAGAKRKVPDRQKVPKQRVIVDGSNVMYWHNNTPQLATVVAVLQHLTDVGLTPGVIFDANAGYLLEDRYLHDHAFAKRLGLSTDVVMVVPKGVQADGYILKSARDLGARVVSNDRFRDWAAEYPEVAQRGHVISGAWRDGEIWLDLAAARVAVDA
jgi:hypothetical protein